MDSGSGRSGLEKVSRELVTLTATWEPRLQELPEKIITRRRNNQHRNIRQIVGHLVDSASNNIHRIVHLQYEESPLAFPDYASHGNNDRWISIQNYAEEDWELLLKLWSSMYLHLAYVILQVDPDKLKHLWINGENDRLSLQEMIDDLPGHYKLHLNEISALIDQLTLDHDEQV